jgi:hypothetical protein
MPKNTVKAKVAESFIYALRWISAVRALLRQLGEGFEPTGEAPTERPARFSASIRERRPHSRV